MGRNFSPNPAEGVNFKPFESWIKGDSKVEPLANDKDVFGDGSVIILQRPGIRRAIAACLSSCLRKGPS